MSRIITDEELKNVINEYVMLGIKSDLFNVNTGETVLSRLKNTVVTVDNSIPGDAYSEIKNGINEIRINENKMNNKPEYYIDEVLFHELSHFANDIFRDLYVYGNSRIKNFKKVYSIFGEANDLVKYPEWGMILLDESVAQYSSQRLVETKYERKIYRDDFVLTDLTEPKVALSTRMTDYAAFYKFGDKFAKTLYKKDDALLKLCQDAYCDNIIEEILTKYNSMENGMKELYEILGYMGNVALAYYASNFNCVIPNTEKNKDKRLVLKSMVEVRDRSERLKEN